MKKYLSAILVLIFVLTCISNVYAGEYSTQIVIEDCRLNEKNELCVSGYLEKGLKNQVLSLVAFKPGEKTTENSFFADQILIQEKNNSGKYIFEFAKGTVQNDFPSGRYTVIAAGDGIQSVEKSFVYFGVDTIWQSLYEVVSANGMNIETVLNKEASEGFTNADILGIDISNMDKLTDKSLGWKIIDDYDKKLDVSSVDFSEEEGKKAVREKQALFYEVYWNAVTIAEYANCRNGSEVMAWLNKYQTNDKKYDARFDFDGDENYSGNNEDLKKYLYDSFRLGKVLDELKEADTVDNGKRYSEIFDGMFNAHITSESKPEQWENESWENNDLYSYNISLIRNLYREHIFMKAIESTNISYSVGILTDYAELMGIDLTGYNSLGNNKLNAFNDIAGKKYNSLEQLKNAFNSAVKKYNSSNTSSSNNSGTGGGSSGGGFSVGKVPDTGNTVNIPGNNNSQEQSNEENTFSDISHIPWKENIETLRKMGIVNGRENGRFEPDGDITRAEFVKLLIAAFEFGYGNAHSEFDDVPEDLWSYPYISSAYELGIVNGISNEYFGADNNITREDMAVMLYRAYIKSGRQIEMIDNVSFKDENNISEYAKEAVLCFAGMGVINGVGDGYFNPSAKATRAQAAKVIYEALMR